MDSEIIKITDKAKKYLCNLIDPILDEKSAIRVSVVGGGCSGLSYKIDFGHRKEKDRTITLGDGLSVFIDPKSSIYLKGVILDYKDGLNGKGFVFTNPNATNTCGCGESFSV